MESHSGWTVMPAYRQFGLSPEFSKLADEGIYFPNFLPSASGTIGSMNALITGFPDAGLNINYESSALKPYGSSLAAIMKQLGYKTRFFYGGFLSWQRLDSYAKNQGFDEVYGGGSMSAGTSTNEWGVDDKYLYDFILKTVDDETPSFNFILSTSNHPPYDLPLQELGYHIKDELPAPLKATKNETVKVLGHLWYADQQGGRFVRQAEKQLDNALFAITGDHTARLQIRFPGDSVVEQTAVPFILYGPKVLNETNNKMTAGAHIDIAPTLIELATDKGFTYTAFGENLLTKKSPTIGLGWQYLIGEDFIANDSEEYGVFALAASERTETRPELQEERKHYNALRALSWQRIKRDNQLP
jgi:phosphoglycerol transferase MdoB-like AlkP superfamily enzyme